MKRYKQIFPVILAFVLLAGCALPAPQNPAAVPETTEAPVQTAPPTTEAAAPPTTQAPTEEPTEAPAEAPAEPFVVTVIPVITAEQTSVTVNTVDAFLAAIAPDTEIILDAALFDLSLATGYGTAKGEYYYWAESFDGPELVIAGVTNLTIRGAGEDRTANVISATPRYANVLNFENCANIHVFGFTAGHTKEPGSCMGGVLNFRNCENVLVENCGLFGCGTLGVKAESSKNLQIVNNEIYECSVGGVEFFNCLDVNVDGNIFRDLGGPVFRIYDSENITCNGGPAVPFQ